MFCLLSRFLWLAALLPGLACAALTEEEMFFKGVADVNGGDLKFLAEAPATPVHHHQNRITLNADSLLTGWAGLEQCHRHLDPVPDMQIVYSRDRIRNIAITQSENIGRSWVHENSVQMTQVARDALICIRAETQALAAEGVHNYTLSNGPYMRRFLDGYYPMQVSLRVRWDIPELRFVNIDPAEQAGFRLTRKPQEIGFDAMFEGELRTRIQFSTAPQ